MNKNQNQNFKKIEIKGADRSEMGSPEITLEFELCWFDGEKLAGAHCSGEVLFLEKCEIDFCRNGDEEEQSIKGGEIER